MRLQLHTPCLEVPDKNLRGVMGNFLARGGNGVQPSCGYDAADSARHHFLEAALARTLFWLARAAYCRASKAKALDEILKFNVALLWPILIHRAMRQELTKEGLAMRRSGQVAKPNEARQS